MKTRFTILALLVTILFVSFFAVFPTQAQNPDPLSIKKSVTLPNNPAQPGDSITYTIVVSNSGVLSATNVQVTDTLPNFVSGANLSVTTTISANSLITYTIPASIATNAPFSTTITNTAAYSYSGRSKQASVGFTIQPTPSLKIVLPTTPNPAYAGPYNNPSKIVIRLTKPENGLASNKFVVQIGTLSATIITRYEGTDHYVLEVMPPAQAANGLYDLTVAATTITLGVITDTEGSAVNHADNNNVDVMLVIDRSGSMQIANNIASARNAAKQFVDLMNNDDKIGVVSFNQTATLNYSLTTVISGTTTISDTKTQAKNSIDPLKARGSTSIGGGLLLAQNELISKGMTLDPWAIVLLTDGVENTAPFVSTVLPGIQSTKTAIHTIGLGPLVEEPFLQNIAAQTGGTYNFVASGAGSQLAGVYNTIAGAITGQQLLFSLAGVVQTGGTDNKQVVIDSSTDQVTFSISWSSSANSLDLTLEDPNGGLIDPAVAASNGDIEYIAGSSYKYYRIISPTLVAGTWTMKITNGVIVSANQAANLVASEVQYLAQVLGPSELDLRPYIDQARVQTGQPIRISITLSDAQPILGAQVLAVVGPLIRVSPNSAADEPNPILYLYDDGLHDDGLANDGVYANTLPGSQTGNSGTYHFTVFANGTSNSGASFAREGKQNVVVGNPAPIQLSDNPQFIYLPNVMK